MRESKQGARSAVALAGDADEEQIHAFNSFREDAHITDLGSMETLVQILAERSAQTLVDSNLAQEIHIAADTAKRWIDLLCRTPESALMTLPVTSVC